VTFLPCDAMRCAVLVHECDIGQNYDDCVHMVRPTIMVSSPYGSSMILVFKRYQVHPEIHQTVSHQISQERCVSRQKLL